VTGGNFLNYVRSGRYNRTFIHGATGGAIVLGGGYTFDSCNAGPQPIDLDPPIPLEATGLSNLDGTIAAWHPSTEPNNATSQWLINVGNDPELDTLNGGYAVFGKVLGDGTAVVSQIANGNPVRLGFFEETPTINYPETNVNCQQFSRDNLILVYMSVIDDDRLAATGSYQPGSRTLSLSIDLGVDGFKQLEFEVDADSTPVTLSPQLETAITLPAPVPNMASYNRISGKLTIPSIAVDGDVLYRNIEFMLDDPATNRFVLQAAE